MTITVRHGSDTLPATEVAADEAQRKPQEQLGTPKLRAGFGGAVRKCVEIVPPSDNNDDDDSDDGRGYGGDRCM